jgi:TPR repeat protein
VAIAGAIVTIIAGTALEILLQRRLGIVNLGIQLGSLSGDLATTAFSRDMEREADRQGLEWMVEVGYQPQGAVRLFSFLQRNNDEPLYSFLSSHPLSSDRIAAASDFSKVWLARRQTSQTMVAVGTSPTQPASKEIALTKAPPPPLAFSVQVGDRVAALNTLIDQQQLLAAPKSDDALDGAKAFSAGNFEVAKASFERCATNGEAPCLNNLGVLYENGLGVKTDTRLATKFFKEAADKGLVLGLTNYAGAVAKGHEGPIDRNKVVALYIDAAAKGSPVAMGTIAYIRQVRGWEKTGASFPSDETIFTYAKVAEMRRIPAGIFALGVMYKDGFNVYKDNQLAEKYLTRASAMGETRADAMLALLYQHELNMPDEAAKYFDLVERSPNRRSVLVLTVHYCTPDIKSRDNKTCHRWQTVGAKTGDPSTVFAYGLNLVAGLGVEKDPREGFSWILAAKAKGSKEAGAFFDKYTFGLPSEELESINTRGKEIIQALPGNTILDI